MALKKPAAATAKPAAPATTKTAAAKPAAPAKKAATPKAEVPPEQRKGYVEPGTILEFTGYAAETESPYFTAGDHVLVVETKFDDKGKPYYAAIKADDKDAYDADPDTVDGDELRPAEVKKVKPAPVAKVTQEDLDRQALASMKDMADVTKLLKAKSGDAVAAAHELFETTNKNFVMLGGVLAHIKKACLDGDDLGYTGQKDPESGRELSQFEALLIGEFDFKVRKAEDLITNYLAFGHLDKAVQDRVLKLGWAKAAIVARAIEDNSEKTEEIITCAEETPANSLRAELRERFVSEEGNNGAPAARNSGKIKVTTFAFKLFEDQAEGVSLILKEAAKQLGYGADDKGLNQTFEHIVNEWAGEHLTEAAVSKATKAVAAKQRDLKKAGIAIPGAEKAKTSAAA